MAYLFPILLDAPEIPPIPGLSYHSDYLSASDESELVAAIDAEPWDTAWERRRQPYGKLYGKEAGPIRPIPSWGQVLSDRLYREGVSDRRFDQMLINEYLPGQGIALHRDYSPFDRTVVSISLLSDCVMDFRLPHTDQRQSLLLQRRSLLILRDEARYQWQHGIARRKNDRWRGLLIPRARRLSITFRLAKRGRNINIELDA